PFNTRRLNCARAFAMGIDQACQPLMREVYCIVRGLQTPHQTVSRPSAAPGHSGTAHGHRKIRDIESAPCAGWFRRSFPLLAQARLHQLRRTYGADRDHAPGSGRAETLDLREALPPRSQLLHGAAGTGSAATRHLYRLDDAPDLGWSNIGRPFRVAVVVHPDRVDVGLP